MGQTVQFQLKRGWTTQLRECRNCQQQLRQQWGRLVVVVLQLADVVDPAVVGAAATTGAEGTAATTAGRGTTTATTSQGILTMAGPTMGHRAAMATVETAGTVGSVLVSFVALPGTKPSSAPRATSHFVSAASVLFPPGRFVFKSSGRLPWSSPCDVANIVNLL